MSAKTNEILCVFMHNIYNKTIFIFSNGAKYSMNILHFFGKGTGHEENQVDCQDRLAYKVLPDGKTIFVISDGCSSSACAEEAAQCNVDVITNIFSQLNIDEISRSSLADLYPVLNKPIYDFAENDIVSCFNLIFKDSLHKLCDSSFFCHSDYCATVLFAICEKEKTAIGHIGDGNVICYGEDGEVVFHSQADNGSDSRHTYFTASDSFCEHFRYNIISSDDVKDIILFSDGPQKMFFYEGDYDTAKGAYDIVVEHISNGNITTNNELADKLREYIGHAKHYVYDDWSLLVGHKGSQHNSVLEEINKPVSLLKIFRKEFNKITFDENGDIVGIKQEDADEKADKEPLSKEITNEQTIGEDENIVEEQLLNEDEKNIGEQLVTEITD